MQFIMTVNLFFSNKFVFNLMIEFLMLVRALRNLAALQDQSCTELIASAQLVVEQYLSTKQISL